MTSAAEQMREIMDRYYRERAADPPPRKLTKQERRRANDADRALHEEKARAHQEEHSR